LGAGIITDVFNDSERGIRYSWYSSMSLYSAAFAPAVGGLVSQYLGWRSIFWVLLACYCALWLSVIFLLPETNPRVRRQRYYDDPDSLHKQRKRLFNPFISLKFLTFPNVLLPCLYIGLMGFTGYSANITFTWAYSDQYGFDSSLVGVFFLFGIIGITAGGIIGGRLPDRIYSQRVQKAKENNGEIYPEMRLSEKWVLLGAIVLATTFTTFGWCLEKNVHFSVGLVCLVFVQFGIMLETCLLTVYVVQSFPKYGSSVQGKQWFISISTVVINVPYLKPAFKPSNASYFSLVRWK
ncbi:major facilitator superfamily domain-containing protein, partial [Fennellomyces sp. T-0311]